MYKHQPKSAYNRSNCTVLIIFNPGIQTALVLLTSMLSAVLMLVLIVGVVVLVLMLKGDPTCGR